MAGAGHGDWPVKASRLCCRHPRIRSEKSWKIVVGPWPLVVGQGAMDSPTTNDQGPRTKGAVRYPLLAAGENQCDVVGLLVGADPVIDCGSDDFADSGQGLAAMFPHQIDQSLFAEFAKIIFRFGDAVAERQENFSPSHSDRRFLVTAIVEQTDYCAALFQPSN